MKKNKGKDVIGKKEVEFPSARGAGKTTKATAADIQRLKEHFDKKFGRMKDA